IVMRALAQDPAKRFASAQQMGEALERYAFQSGGVTTGDVATLMKELFAEDRARWIATTRLALDMEVPSDALPVREMKMSQTSIPLGSSPGRTALTAAESPVIRRPPLWL